MLLDDIEHLPKVVTNVLGIKDVLLAIEPEIIQLREDISDLIKELYVKTTKDFITRWEKDFSLKYDAGLTLEQRRQRILNKLARKRPLTWNNLRLLIKNNLAENVQFYLSNDSANYRFKIIINPEMEEVFDRSKFTVVGSPTITDDGIASGFDNANANNIQIPTAIISQIATANTWKVGVNGTVQESGYTYSNVRTGNEVRYDLIQINRIANGFLFVCCLDKNGTQVAKNIPIVFSDTYNGKAYKATLEFTGTKYIATVQFEDGKVLTNSLDSTYKIKFYNYGDKFELGYKCINGSIDLKQFSITVDGVKVFSGTKRVPKGISEMEKAVRQAKPAYLTFDILVTDIVRRCGTFNCGTNPL